MFIILQRPIITEKSMKLAENSLYTFAVARNANKKAVAKVVAERFKVRVLGVKIINTKSEKKMQRRARKYYQTPTFKKALVQLAKGQKIALFEVPKEEAEVTRVEEEPTVKERKNLLRDTKVKIEKGMTDTKQTTQRKVITGK